MYFNKIPDRPYHIKARLTVLYPTFSAKDLVNKIISKQGFVMLLYNSENDYENFSIS